jgi:hypothetical protein
VVVTTKGLSVLGNGVTVTGGLTVVDTGVYVNGGGMTVNAGGLSVAAGGLTVASNGASVTGGITVHNSGLYVSGGLSVVGDVVATGTVSDRRLKRNITPVIEPLDKVSRLRGVYFNWIADEPTGMHFDTQRHVGIIAQDVQQVLPEIVQETGTGNYLKVDYPGLIPLLIEAIRALDESFGEQKRQSAAQGVVITSLKLDNAELKKGNVELKKDNAELKKDNVELKKDNVELKKVVDEKSAAMDALIRDLRELRSEFAVMKSSLNRHNSAIEALQRVVPTAETVATAAADHRQGKAAAI